MPKRFIVSDEEADDVKEWLKLSPEAKEAGMKFAKMMGKAENEASFYQLLAMTNELSKMVAFRSHLSWFGATVLRISVFASALMGIAGFIGGMLYLFGKKS